MGCTNCYSGDMWWVLVWDIVKDFLVKLSTLSEAKKALEGLFKGDSGAQFWLSAVKRGKKRSTTANAQIHLWFGQIAKHYGDRSALEVKCFCKDAIGLPILSDSPTHGDKLSFFLSELNYYKHTYENKMKLIQFIPVTSEMSASEIKMFMEQMIFYWADLGIHIEHKR